MINARADLAPFVAKIERKSNNNIVLFRLQIKNKDNAIRTCLLHFVQMKYAWNMKCELGNGDNVNHGRFG